MKIFLFSLFCLLILFKPAGEAFTSDMLCEEKSIMLKAKHDRLSAIYERLIEMQMKLDAKSLSYSFCKNDVTERCSILYGDLSDDAFLYTNYKKEFTWLLREIAELIKAVDSNCTKQMEEQSEKMRKKLSERFK